MMLWAEGPGSGGCGGEPTHTGPLRSDTMQSDGRELKFFTCCVHGPELNKGSWPSDWQLGEEGQRGDASRVALCGVWAADGHQLERGYSQEGGGGPVLRGQWMGTHKGCWTGRSAAWGLSGVGCLSRSLGNGETAQTRGRRMCPGEVSGLPQGLRAGEGRAARTPSHCRAFLDPAAQTSWTSNQLTWRTSRR